MVSSSFLSWSENLHGFIGGSGQISTFLYFIGQQSCLSYIYRIKINHSQQYHPQKWTEKTRSLPFMFKKLSFSKKTTPQKTTHTQQLKNNTTKTHGHKKIHHPLQEKTQRNDSQEEANNERWRLEAERIAVKAEQVPPWRVKPKPKKMPKPNGIVDVRRKKRSTESTRVVWQTCRYFWCVLFRGLTLLMWKVELKTAKSVFGLVVWIMVNVGQ